ncbi:MAG: two-component system sensor histidine kinase/response regulator [Planctomycetaceae bacterium]|jgi:two-component system sensor histidine kinase/response regulator
MPESLRILLIDDDENTFALTRELLREINGRTVELEWAADPDAGLAGILADKHEIYLLDYRLGATDGIEVLSRAKAAGSKAPVIILTGQSDREIDQRALEAGASDYLVKDVFDVSRLEHSIRYALERQRLSKELELERYLLQSLMENLPDNIFFKDRESKFVRVSRAMADWFNLADPIDAVGKTDKDFFADQHSAQARADEVELMELGEPVLDKVEKETWPDGRTTWVSTSKLPLRDRERNVVGTFGVSRDITAQQEALNALSQSESLNRQIVDTALDAFVGMDAEGTIIDWNPQAEVIFGWKAEDALGQTLADTIIPERFRERHFAGLKRFLETGEGSVIQRRLELVALHRSGKEFPVEVTISPIRDSQSCIFSAFVHDITNRKQAEKELRASKEAAESANRAKSDFLANMSHEIRTPMNAVIGMTELVLDTELTRSQHEYLGMVRDSADSLLTLINDILDFSKIEAGRLELESSIFSIRDMLGDTLRSLSVRAHREELELACHIDPTVPDALVGDPSRLRQVVVNLVGNAIKFTQHGEVIVHVDVDQQDGRSVLLHFAVADTGIGIQKEKLKSVFQAFEQADTSTTRQYGGTGLGLTICSRLTQLMNGSVWAESDLGKGSTFHFTARLAVSDTPPRVSTKRIVQGSRVLIVDDNATNRLILDEMLTNWGIETSCVEGVDEAIESLRKAREAGKSYDLVLSDVHMPQKDGFALAAEIRKDEKLAGAVIMMLTSGDRSEDVEQCRKFGVSAYIRKPIKQSELFDSMVAVLAIDGTGDSASQQAEDSERTEVIIPPLRVLLAEDSVVNQKLALALLKKWGHTGTVANNGKAAVDLATNETFDVVLMDVQMPEMDGLEATRQIRQSEVGTDRHLPIIAMTAHAMKGDRELCLESGMDDYVSKPVRPWQLINALSRFFAEDARTVGVSREEATRVETRNGGDSAPAESYQVDWPVALRITQGDRDLLREIAGAFLEESRIVLADLKYAIKKEDAPTAQRMAHTIKANFRTFGVTDAHDLAFECEKAGKAGDLKFVAENLAEIQKASKVVSSQLRAFIDTGQFPG